MAASHPPSSFPAGARTGQELYRRAKRRIPGGTQLLSKRPELFLPEEWPAYYRRAEGCSIWDLDDRRYVDFTSCGIGCCLLGYADPTVNEAVTNRVAQGSMCTLNPPDEVDLAEVLCSIHPWADAVRYARTGGEAMAIAVRLARACTGRTKIAFCGYHGWSDWYLATNLGANGVLERYAVAGLEPAGVPAPLAGTTVPFHYNRIEELEAIVAAEPQTLAAIVMEPVRHEYPRDGFLERVRRLATEAGAVLIFDEITSGWRSHHGGIHLKLGVAPDLAVFAKSISNGFPMAAIIGRAAVMEAAQLTFVSSTYWTEAIGPAAALATIAKLREVDAVSRIQEAGARVLAGWSSAAARRGIAIKAGSFPALCTLAFDYGDESRAVMTLFTQEMLDRGYLANGLFYPTCAHDSAIVDRYLAAVDEVFAVLHERMQRGQVRAALRGPVAHSGFSRLT